MDKKIKLIKEIHANGPSDKVNREITLQLNNVIFILTGEILIESDEYLFNGFKLEKIETFNNVLKIHYIFKHGVFICDITQKDNIGNRFTVIYNNEYIIEKNIYKNEFNVALNDDFKFLYANSLYDSLYLEDRNETRYQCYIIINIYLEIEKKKKKHVIKCYGLINLDIEINNKDNNFYKDFIFLMNSIYKSNNKLEFFNKYPTEMDMLKNPKKVLKLIDLFTKQYEKKYNELQMNLDLLRMINI